MNGRIVISLAVVVWALFSLGNKAVPDESNNSLSANLVKNPLFKKATGNGQQPADYVLEGDAVWTQQAGSRTEFTDRGVALDSGKRTNGAGSVAQNVTGFDLNKGRWFRFSFRGLPEDGFAVTNDDLYMKAEFYAKKGESYLDGVTRKIYPLVERARLELAANGNDRKGGAAAWQTYTLDFKVPFPEVDQLRVSAGFRNGTVACEKSAIFYVTEFSLVAIPDPVSRPKLIVGSKGLEVQGTSLVPLGGHWFHQSDSGNVGRPDKLTITPANSHRLFYKDHQISNPFAENMSAGPRKGYKDVQGKLVDEDRFVIDNVTVRFEDGKTMIVRARNLPNHPTDKFPGGAGPGGPNPSYIQEHDYTYYLPLDPQRNPQAVAMKKNNSNRALPMGAIGIAINGVVFYNPFDADSMDASDVMDRCCGHPSPDNRYHYHKYPICVKSPFSDEGEEHSPLIGWAFDGFPIYGPYESKGLMAKDSKDNPLNEFNVHYDEVHGWHYHVTPGKFPYIIGGYWGEVDRRNYTNQRGPGGPPGGPQGPGRLPGRRSPSP